LHRALWTHAHIVIRAVQVIAEVVGQVAQHLQQDRRDQGKSEHRPAEGLMENRQSAARL
jgi:hypothetical protein